MDEDANSRVVRIQAAFRGYRARLEKDKRLDLRCRETAATRIQCWIRWHLGQAERKQLEQTSRVQNFFIALVVRIQAASRGYRARLLRDKRLDLRWRAAARIQ